MLRTPFAIAALLALSACDDQGFRPVGVDTGTVVERCTTTVQSTWPRPGSTDAHWRQSVEFTLSEPDPTAVVQAPYGGEQSVRADGVTVVYTPDEPLQPLTDYEIGLDYCGGNPVIGFTTSALGLPLEADPVGRTFAVDLDAARFTAGEGLADVAATFLAPRLLLHVVDEDAEGLHLRVTLADPEDPEQPDPCARTVDLPPADFGEAPWYGLAASDVRFGAGAAEIVLQQIALGATLAPDTTWMGGGRFQAVIDARDVAAVIASSSAEGLCRMAEGLGVPCEACPHDDEPWCVAVEALDLAADAIPGTVVEPIHEVPPSCG